MLTRRLLGLLLVAVGALFAALVLMLNTYTAAPVDPRWAVRGDIAVPDGAVTVRFSGTATLLFSDGDTRWMVDGWFSRPGPLRLAIGKIAPDLEAIERGLAANDVRKLAAVLPVHSHYDHAMDAPEVARRTGAMLLGSETTANIGRGWGLPEAKMRVLRDREPVRVGRFLITPIVSRHYQFPQIAVRERALGKPPLTKPLVPPVAALDYPVGEAYVLHISHPAGSWLIVGSAGFEVGALQSFHADTVFLGVGGLGAQTADYREAYWRETVEAVSPSRVIPIHYDSLTGPLEGPFRGPVMAMALLSGGREATESFLREKALAHPQLQFVTLPRFEEVVLFE
ncbi:MAG: MBL fold metallo-hydrolase [Halioglobus sp.]|nr:MBL fold metallo-hydrolase [Halioglobus sp.]